MTTTAERYGTTIQTWPGGASFEYRGDIHGLAEQRELRKGHDRSAEWGPGTEDDWRLIRIAELANIYAERDILCCDSSLVDDLIKAVDRLPHRDDLAEGFSIDSIENMYRDPSSWTLEECRDYIREYGGDEPTEGNVWQMDRDDLIEQLTNVGIECRDDESTETLREAVIANIDDETIIGIDDWREACRDIAQDNPAEVFEWWRVSSWLCGKLREIGEVVIDNNYGYWWGRTCTGQGLIMDGTLQQIAAQHVDR